MGEGYQVQLLRQQVMDGYFSYNQQMKVPNARHSQIFPEMVLVAGISVKLLKKKKPYTLNKKRNFNIFHNYFTL